MRLFATRRRRRGAVLILALWIVVILSTVYYSLQEELVLDTRLASLQAQDMKAFYAARAGVARAMVDLTNDLIIDLSGETQPYDALSDVWAEDDRLVDVPLVNPRSRYRSNEIIQYSVLIEDEESKININRCNHPVILGLLLAMGLDEDRARDIADAIIDWRTPELEPINRLAPTKSEYYAEKIREDERIRRREGQVIYLTKNDQYTSLEELLSVYGVTPELYYDGEDAEGRRSARRSRARRTVSRRTTAAERVTRPDGTAVGERRGLRDFLSVWSTGFINVNTAPREVLAALAFAEGRPIQEALTWADQVINQRGGRHGSQDTSFRTVDDFHREAAFPRPRQAGIRGLDVQSTTFRVTAVGEIKPGQDQRGVTHSIQAIVGRQTDRFPRAPLINDPRGIWREEPLEPPYYKVMRETEEDANNVIDPVVRIIQWSEW